MEIDVSKCEFKYKDSCCLYDEKKCKYIKDCYYKQLQQLKIENELLKNERTIDLRNQLEQLKAENEELKFKLDMQESIGYPLCFTCIVDDCECNKSKLYEQCLDEIEEICKKSHTTEQQYYYRTSDTILQKIKEVKQ